MINNRARVLGGGSCINAGFYSRAEAEAVVGIGWDERLLNESYRWVENKIVLKPILGPWQSSFKNALLEAGVVPDNGFSYDHIYGLKLVVLFMTKMGIDGRLLIPTTANAERSWAGKAPKFPQYYGGFRPAFGGQGMSDNSMNGKVVPSPAPVEVSNLQVVGITRFGTYIEAGSGKDFAS